MAFALRSAQPAEENNVQALKDVKAGTKMTLLQQGSKRRALGDIGNIGNTLAPRNAKDNSAADGALKPGHQARTAAALAPASTLPGVCTRAMLLRQGALLDTTRTTVAAVPAAPAPEPILLQTQYT